MTTPQAPYNLSAEKAVIGSVLLDPKTIKDIRLSASDFYLESHQMIFKTVQVMIAKKTDVDYITVCNELEAKGQLSEVGGGAAIMGFINDTVSSLHAASYAEIVRGMARRRVVIAQAQAMVIAAYDPEGDVDAVVAKSMDNLVKTAGGKGGAIHIGEILSTVYDEVEKAMDNPQEVYGIPTGFPDLDAITFGLQKGEVFKIGGEPGVGKSVLACQIMESAAKAGHAGVLYQLEMKAGNVVRRLLSGGSKVATPKMMQGKLSDNEWDSFIEAVERLSKLDVYIDANSQLTTADIRSDIRRLKKTVDIELVVVDYENLLNDYEKGSDPNELSKLRSRRLHSIAKEENVAMLVLDSLTKAGMNGEAEGTTGIGGSAEKGHDADVVMMMRRDRTNARLITCTFEKFREGSAAKRFIQLVMQQGYPAFGSVTKQ